MCTRRALRGSCIEWLAEDLPHGQGLHGLLRSTPHLWAGNAVTVPVSRWLGERLANLYQASLCLRAPACQKQSLGGMLRGASPGRPVSLPPAGSLPAPCLLAPATRLFCPFACPSFLSLSLLLLCPSSPAVQVSWGGHPGPAAGAPAGGGGGHRGGRRAEVRQAQAGGGLRGSEGAQGGTRTGGRGSSPKRLLYHRGKAGWPELTSPWPAAPLPGRLQAGAGAPLELCHH